MSYSLELTKRARKQLAQAPPADRIRLAAALQEMQSNPFSGDIKRLSNAPFNWRRRVGDWRVLYNLDPTQRLILVARVERRTTTTYRKH